MLKSHLADTLCHQTQNTFLHKKLQFKAIGQTLLFGFECAISDEIVCTGLDLKSSQGDKAILEILKLYGKVETHHAVVSPNNQNPFNFDAQNVLTLFCRWRNCKYCKRLPTIQTKG